MKRIKLEVIPSPKNGTASVIAAKPSFIKINPYVCIKSYDFDGSDYLCGACGVILAESTNRGRISNLVIKCSSCGCHNSVRGS
ncbi:hypothetical protein Q6A51_13320 [Pseudomonas sp. KFB-139]|uniref:Uncharacterized protein n=1 Tax=Pseudomonas serbiensis TaxID=3064350 RepID=A0ABT9CVB7_9PSED|nr:hypothetical protein [Pseudomonas sp. KFB-138]MDO7927770.1 hypothetical protein [Pseudomonas sp. KFB-138]